MMPKGQELLYQRSYFVKMLTLYAILRNQYLKKDILSLLHIGESHKIS